MNQCTVAKFGFLCTWDSSFYAKNDGEKVLNRQFKHKSVALHFGRLGFQDTVIHLSVSFSSPVRKDCS